ncbi:MAG TPA: hypothetical protein VHB21_10865, partial [Minicystis sp.]|nr:hypothetical protein [Minicystis sp.]
NGPEIDELFTVITDKMGTHGPDILYELVTTRGGSRAAERADALLKDPAIVARGTPAMRIAYELRAAPCEKKPPLFERAKTDGDTRALGQLVMIRDACYSRGAACCAVEKDPALKETMAALRAKLGQ